MIEIRDGKFASCIMLDLALYTNVFMKYYIMPKIDDQNSVRFQRRSRFEAMGNRHQSGVLLCVVNIVPESDVAHLLVGLRAVYPVVIAVGIRTLGHDYSKSTDRNGRCVGRQLCGVAILNQSTNAALYP